MPLVLVGTPIGNLGDLSPRAVEALAGADAICCEDTRRTGRLLQHAGVARPALIVVNDHTEARAIAGVLERLDRGERVAVVTDAGHARHLRPGRAARAGGRRRGPPRRGGAGAVGRRHRARRERAADRPVRVRGVPAAQGLGADEPARRAGRRAAHDRALRGPAPRAPAPWPTWPAACGAERRVSIGRELTKLHEEHWRGTPGRRGRVGDGDRSPGASSCSCSTARRRRRPSMPSASRPRWPTSCDDGASARDAAATVADALGVPKRRAYELAVQLRDRDAERATRRWSSSAAPRGPPGSPRRSGRASPGRAGRRPAG